MIERVTYARLYALPGYENERFEAVAIVQGGDVGAAFDEAYRQVEAQYERVITSRRNAGEPQAPPSPPATPKQRNYIARLMDDLGWHSEHIAAYASDQNIDLVTMTTRQASAFIDGIKRLAEERSEDRPPPMNDGDLPF